LILLGHDYDDDTPCDNLDVMSDLSSPLAVVPSLEFSTISSHLEDSLIVLDSSFPLAPLGSLRRETDLRLDVSFDDQCWIVESEDTSSDEHSLDDPSVVYFSEVTTQMDPSDPIFDSLPLT